MTATVPRLQPYPAVAMPNTIQPVADVPGLTIVPYPTGIVPALTVGPTVGTNTDRGIASVNIYNTSRAVVHEKITGEPSPISSSGILVGQVVVDYDHDGTRGLDYAAVDGEANCQTEGVGGLTGWWGTAIALRGEATISGGVERGVVRSILAEARQTFDGQFTDVQVTRGEVTVVLPVGQSTAAMKAYVDAGKTVWIGDANSDVIQDDTTVVACDPDLRTFTLSAPPSYSVVEKLTWCRSDGVVIGAEIGALNYASTTHSILSPLSDVWSKGALAVSNRGTSPLAAFIFNYVNKVGAYDGLQFQQVAENFARFFTPGRPGAVGMRVDPSSIAFNGVTLVAASQVLTRPRPDPEPDDVFDVNVFEFAQVGMRVWGLGIRGNSYVTAVADDFKTITISRPAMANLTGVTVRMSKWSAGVLLPDQIPVQALDTDGTTLRDLIKLDGNQVKIGDASTEAALPNNVNLRGQSFDGQAAYAIGRVGTTNDVFLGSATLATQKLVLQFGATGGVRLGTVVAPGIFSGAGSPNSNVTAPVSSVYLQTDGGAGTSFWVKETGAGNTGWVAK